MTSSRRPWLGLLTLIVLSLAGHAGAETLEAVNAEGGVALHGFDPVAYFEAGEPTRGSEEWTHAWRGATWRFASEANRRAFAADPESWAPRYGGYCAYAMSIDRVADVDPDDWAIVDGRLYLNNNAAVHALWKLGKQDRIEKADRNWSARSKTEGMQ